MGSTSRHCTHLYHNLTAPYYLSWSFHSMVSVHLNSSMQQLLGLLSCLLWPSHLLKVPITMSLTGRSQSHMGFEWSSLTLFFPYKLLGNTACLNRNASFFSSNAERASSWSKDKWKEQARPSSGCVVVLLIPSLQGAGPLSWKAEVCSPWNSSAGPEPLCYDARALTPVQCSRNNFSFWFCLGDRVYISMN